MPQAYPGNVYSHRTLGACSADSDHNGEINVWDLLALLSSWGECPAFCPTDINASGTVNVTDLLALLATWGACP